MPLIGAAFLSDNSILILFYQEIREKQQTGFKFDTKSSRYASGALVLIPVTRRQTAQPMTILYTEVR